MSCDFRAACDDRAANDHCWSNRATDDNNNRYTTTTTECNIIAQQYFYICGGLRSYSERLSKLTDKFSVFLYMFLPSATANAFWHLLAIRKWMNECIIVTGDAIKLCSSEFVASCEQPYTHLEPFLKHLLRFAFRVCNNMFYVGSSTSDYRVARDDGPATEHWWNNRTINDCTNW